MYEKDGKVVWVSEKFIYLEQIYEIKPMSANCVRERRYVSDVPLKRKSKDLKKDKYFDKKTQYKLLRFLELESAPEKYLIENDFKKHETN